MENAGIEPNQQNKELFTIPDTKTSDLDEQPEDSSENLRKVIEQSKTDQVRQTEEQYNE